MRSSQLAYLTYISSVAFAIAIANGIAFVFVSFNILNFPSTAKAFVRPLFVAIFWDSHLKSLVVCLIAYSLNVIQNALDTVQGVAISVWQQLKLFRLLPPASFRLGLTGHTVSRVVKVIWGI